MYIQYIYIYTYNIYIYTYCIYVYTYLYVQYVCIYIYIILVMPSTVWRFPRAAAIWFSSYFPCQGKNAGPMLWLLHSEVWAAGSAFLAEVDREMGKTWGENLAMKSGCEMLWRCMDQILNTPVLCYKDVWCMAMYGRKFWVVVVPFWHQIQVYQGISRVWHQANASFQGGRAHSSPIINHGF